MSGPDVTLLCLPRAGASATMYLRWRRVLPAWLRLVPAELPGRGERYAQPHADDLDALAMQLCDRHAMALQGRFALLAHFHNRLADLAGGTRHDAAGLFA